MSENKKLKKFVEGGSFGTSERLYRGEIKNSINFLTDADFQIFLASIPWERIKKFQRGLTNDRSQRLSLERSFFRTRNATLSYAACCFNPADKFSDARLQIR